MQPRGTSLARDRSHVLCAKITVESSAVRGIYLVRLRVPIFIGCLLSHGCLNTGSSSTQRLWVPIFMGCLFSMGAYYPKCTVFLLASCVLLDNIFHLLLGLTYHCANNGETALKCRERSNSNLWRFLKFYS